MTLAALERAGVRVTVRDDGRLHLRPTPPPELMAEARQHRDGLAKLLRARQVAANTDPTGRCPSCGHNLWWRKPYAPAGAEPWHCAACVPPDLTDHVDATAFP